MRTPFRALSVSYSRVSQTVLVLARRVYPLACSRKSPKGQQECACLTQKLNLQVKSGDHLAGSDFFKVSSAANLSETLFVTTLSQQKIVTSFWPSAELPAMLSSCRMEAYMCLNTS